MNFLRRIRFHAPMMAIPFLAMRDTFFPPDDAPWERCVGLIVLVVLSPLWLCMLVCMCIVSFFDSFYLARKPFVSKPKQ